MDDPYGTGPLRERVLAAWTAAPARFREDANAEEDYALGGYRDRVVVELAQNAADAAVRAGVPGRLRLALAGGVLTAANTGAPLDAAGVEALSTLRASAKRDDEGAVGRFGVGFAAVVAVSDAPEIYSVGPSGTPAGVAWSAARTRDLVAAVPALSEELGRRGGHVPVLRLPFPAVPPAGDPRVGEGAVVRLPLRDAEAEQAVRRQLEQTGPALMLALPGLAAVEIEVDGTTRTITARHAVGVVVIDGVRWQTVEDHGRLDPALLADRPTEDRGRTTWQVRWALPTGAGLADLGVERVLHAPTPTGERVDLPAVLIASFPLAPDRRHVAPGPLADFLVDRAADAYVRLMRELPPTPQLLSLVPQGLPAGELDARLRRAILARLPEAPLLPVAGDDGVRARGRDTVAVDGPPAFLGLLGEVLPGLLPAGWPVNNPALGALGVRRLPLADVVDMLATLDTEPGWWQRLYAALADVRSGAGELGALPVPLADGRLVRGPRGLLIAADGLDPESLGALGLRFVHADAVHPLLFRLGAVEAGPRAVLADPAVRAAVAGSYEADDPESVADAVLGLVAAAGLDPGDEPWLAELALPGDDGELYPAGELLLPGSPLRGVMAPDAPFGVVAEELVERWGEAPLEAVGVLRGFAVLRQEDVELGTVAEGAFELDGDTGWAQDVVARMGPLDLPLMLPELVAVRDLELVDDWKAALGLLAEPPLRAAVVEPAHVLLPDGSRAGVPSYTAWWLRRHPVLDGLRPADLRAAEAVELAGLYDPAPGDLDPVLLLALGVRRSLPELLAEPGGFADLLERLGDPGRTVTAEMLRRLWRALTETVGVMMMAEPPERVRALVDGVPEVVPAADAMVVDAPYLLPLLAGQPLVITRYDGAVALAELLDLSLAGEEIDGVIEPTGARHAVPSVAAELLEDTPDTYLEYDRLVVDGRPVSWWYDDETGDVHAADVGGLARGLAWAAGRWADRLLVEAVLRTPDTLPVLLAERDLEP